MIVPDKAEQKLGHSQCGSMSGDQQPCAEDDV